MNTTFKKLVIAIAATSAIAYAGISSATDITGAGATFPYPAYAKWAEAYKAKTGVSMNYQSIGSGGGIKQITAKTVDFGASDMPLKPEELNKQGLMQFPTLIGGVVPVINVNGIANGQLHLDGPTLANIYLGKITKWNDPAIAALNKGVALPDDDITVVHRSDGSGTSFIFTNYLSKVSGDWKSSVGEGTAVSWKAGTGGKGNEGVASYVQRIKGAIGYVEYAYALQNKMAAVQMKNKEGNFVVADEASFKAAAAGADWAHAPGFYEILTDEAGKASWPISGATFILIHKAQEKPESGLAVLKFFDWAYVNGGKMAADLDYVSMPDSVVKLIHGAWSAQVKDTHGKQIWK
ncbi:MAG: phosphate ABC transporter substrate-binding protein PstS [Gallionella sp.]|nr:phosphate ABC transporter substrate-binding protein PstS [Gallionella sp.]MDD4947550.1 phosphate ABC transporter substrate-binding protein PstS [Gallionella sp.]MDD5611705.1 phosphate ABC transporter substrate-binding protein PstS [Gallionella sp.]